MKSCRGRAFWCLLQSHCHSWTISQPLNQAPFMESKRLVVPQSIFTFQLGLLMLGISLLTCAGCTAWPFAEKQRTSIITPSMRVSTVREIGARADQADGPEQQRLSDQLAGQIRTEPDPLVRRAIQEAAAEIDTPLTQAILLAGLNDTDRDVRITCCQKLGERGVDTSVGSLRSVLENDEEIDVRLAAVDALGQIRTTASVQALSLALHDRDPAMQYAGVQAMKIASGQNFGNDVEAWREYADGDTPQILPPASVAERVKEMLPF